jgi:hypothetical protein
MIPVGSLTSPTTQRRPSKRQWYRPRQNTDVGHRPPVGVRKHYRLCRFGMITMRDSDAFPALGVVLPAADKASSHQSGLQPFTVRVTVHNDEFQIKSRRILLQIRTSGPTQCGAPRCGRQESQTRWSAELEHLLDHLSQCGSVLSDSLRLAA